MEETTTPKAEEPKAQVDAQPEADGYYGEDEEGDEELDLSFLDEEGDDEVDAPKSKDAPTKQ